MFPDSDRTLFLSCLCETTKETKQEDRVCHAYLDNLFNNRLRRYSSRQIWRLENFLLLYKFAICRFQTRTSRPIWRLENLLLLHKFAKRRFLDDYQSPNSATGLYKINIFSDFFLLLKFNWSIMKKGQNSLTFSWH